MLISVQTKKLRAVKGKSIFQICFREKTVGASLYNADYEAVPEL